MFLHNFAAEYNELNSKVIVLIRKSDLKGFLCEKEAFLFFSFTLPLVECFNMF